MQVRSRIRVLHLITDLNVGGAERSLQFLLMNSDINKFEMKVISVLPEGVISRELQAAGVEVINLSVTSPLKLIFKIPVLIKNTVEFNPDIMHGWMYHGALLAWILNKLILKRACQVWGIRHSLHEYLEEKISTRIIIKFLALVSASPSRILYNSSTSKKHHEMIGFKGNNSEVVSNGYDLNKWSPDPSAKEKLDKELKFGNQVVLVGLIARYDKIKDHNCFLSAAEMLCIKYTNVRIVLVGKDVLLNNKCLNIPNRQSLIEKVFCLGERYDVPKITAALDIAVSSSKSEAFSNSIAEALCCGVPCVATDVGDSAQIIGEAGIVVPPRSPILLFEAIERLILMEPSERVKTGILGRNRMIENYSKEKILAQYSTVYSELR